MISPSNLLLDLLERIQHPRHRTIVNTACYSLGATLRLTASLQTYLSSLCIQVAPSSDAHSCAFVLTKHTYLRAVDYPEKRYYKNCLSHGLVSNTNLIC